MRRRALDTDPAALALRELQKLDYTTGYAIRYQHATRVQWFTALDLLGQVLALSCTGVPNPKAEGGYSHDGDTCPIHEWLVDGDYDVCDGIAGDVPATATVGGGAA